MRNVSDFYYKSTETTLDMHLLREPDLRRYMCDDFGSLYRDIYWCVERPCEWTQRHLDIRREVRRGIEWKE